MGLILTLEGYIPEGWKEAVYGEDHAVNGTAIRPPAKNCRFAALQRSILSHPREAGIFGVCAV